MFSFFRRFLAPIGAWVAEQPLHGDHGDDPLADPHEMRDPGRFAIDDEGWIDAADDDAHFARIPTARIGGYLATPESVPEGVVWHWPGTVGLGAREVCARVSARPRPGQHVGSWHVWIGRDGTIVQCASFRRQTWHAGGTKALRYRRDATGYWRVDDEGRLSANAWTIGVEVDCGGEVRLINGAWRVWPFAATSPAVPETEITDAMTDLTASRRVRHFHRFTDAQEDAAVDLLAALAVTYGWSPARLAPQTPLSQYALGHYQIAPGRKSDPGPEWMRIRLPRIVRRVFGPAVKLAPPEVV